MGKEPPYQVKHIKQIDRAQAHNMAQLILSFFNHDTQQIHFKIEKIFAPSKHNGHNQGKFT
jgi:hypothetical protein